MTRTPWGDTDKLSERTLRPGPGMPRAEASRNRRERLFAAMVASVAERGYEATTVAHLTRIARVSRSGFYSEFSSKQDCFLATIGEIATLAQAAARHAFESAESWEERLLALLHTVVGSVAEWPETASLLYLDAYTAGPEAIAAAESSLDVFDELAQDAIAESPDHAGVPPEVVRAVIGGIHIVIEDHLRAGRADRLPDRIESLWRWAISYRTPPDPLRPARRRSRPAGSPRRIELDPQARIVSAMAEAVARQGYAQTTVADVVREASTSLRTFYDHFEDKEDAFLAVIAQGRAEALAVIGPAFARAPTWEQSVKAGLRALFSFLAAERAWAGVAAEVRAAGPRASADGQDTMRMFGDFLAQGEAAQGLPGVTRGAIGGAVYLLALDEIRAGRAAQLPDLLPIATYLALAPYVGSEAATRIALDDSAPRPGGRQSAER